MTSAIKRRLQRLTSNLSAPSNPSFDVQPGQPSQHPRSHHHHPQPQPRKALQTVVDPELNTDSTSSATSISTADSVSSLTATTTRTTAGTDTATFESSTTVLSSSDCDLDSSAPHLLEDLNESAVQSKPKQGTVKDGESSADLGHRTASPARIPPSPIKPPVLETGAISSPAQPIIDHGNLPTVPLCPIIIPTTLEPTSFEVPSDGLTPSTGSTFLSTSKSSTGTDIQVHHPTTVDKTDMVASTSVSPKPADRRGRHLNEHGLQNGIEDTRLASDSQARDGTPATSEMTSWMSLDAKKQPVEIMDVKVGGEEQVASSDQGRAEDFAAEGPAIETGGNDSTHTISTTTNPELSSLDNTQVHTEINTRSTPRAKSESRAQAEAEVKARSLGAGEMYPRPPTPPDSTDPHCPGRDPDTRSSSLEKEMGSVDRGPSDGVVTALTGNDRTGVSDGQSSFLAVGAGSSTSRGFNGSASGGGTGNRFSSFFGGGRDHPRQQNTQHQDISGTSQLGQSGLSPASSSSSNAAIGISNTFNGTPTRSNPLSLPRASSMRNRPSTAPNTGKNAGVVPTFGFGSTRSPAKAGKVEFANKESQEGDVRPRGPSTDPPFAVPKSTSTPIHLNLSRFGVGPAGNGIPRSSSVGFQRTFADDDLFGAGPASPPAIGEVVNQKSGFARVTRFPLPSSAKLSGSGPGSGQAKGMTQVGQRISTYADVGPSKRPDRGKGRNDMEDSGALTDGEWYAAKTNGARNGQISGTIRATGQKVEPRARTRSESGPTELNRVHEEARGLLAVYPMVTKDTDLLPMSTTAQPDIPPENEFPPSRGSRARRFSWEINRAVVDGKEFLGFGSNGEVGRVRLRDTLGDTASEGEERGVSTYGTRHGTPGLASSYAVGYERSVLKMEAMLHQAVYELSDRRHTYFPIDLPPPRRVLDLGTGLGLWPIAMSQIWKDTKFVGMDIAPVQTDLEPLARVQSMLRNKGAACIDDPATSATVTPDWDLARRNITWRIGDILDTLPFGSGSFDMVHVRFGGLGIPENRYPEFLDEISRVLVKGTGVLEMVEMSYAMPLTAPPALRNSYNSLLLANFLHQTPHVQIRADLAMSGLKFEEVVCKTYSRGNISADHPSDILANAIAPWVDSATGKGRHGRSKGMSDSSQKMGLPAFETKIAVEFAKVATGPLDEPLTATTQNTPQSMHSSANTSHVGRKRSDSGEDDVVLVGWIARKK